LDDMQSFYFSILITIRRALSPRVTSSQSFRISERQKGTSGDEICLQL
jgi:hypothetical protein